jgi:methylated-DNA-[protein]-cysteine S-methyltransferase
MTPLPDHLLESVAAEAVREGLADALFTVVPTPIGRLTVVSGERGIVRVGFEEEPLDRLLATVASRMGPRVLKTDRELADVREALQEYLEGERTEDLDLPYDLRLVASPFRRAVLETLGREVHRGETVRYGELAARAGNPRAARAAGTACATNPIPIVVPCHRVLPSTGGVGNYGGGSPRKVQLLELEGALPSRTPRSSPTS